MGPLLRWCTPDHALRIAPLTNEPTPSDSPIIRGLLDTLGHMVGAYSAAIRQQR